MVHRDCKGCFRRIFKISGPYVENTLLQLFRMDAAAEMLKKISTYDDNISHHTSKFSHQYIITKIVFDVLVSIKVKTSKTFLL